MKISRGILLPVLMLLGLGWIVGGCGSWLPTDLSPGSENIVAPQAKLYLKDKITVDFYVVKGKKKGTSLEIEGEQLVEQVHINPLQPAEFCQALRRYQQQMLRELAKEWRVGASWGFGYRAKSFNKKELNPSELEGLEKKCE